MTEHYRLRLRAKMVGSPCKARALDKWTVINNFCQFSCLTEVKRSPVNFKTMIFQYFTDVIGMLKMRIYRIYLFPFISQASGFRANAKGCPTGPI